MRYYYKSVSSTLVIVLVLICLACNISSTPKLRAFEWPKADRLFLKDPKWVGADDAFSIDLGNGRTLWLFADTFIDPSGQHSRQNATMIRNSVAIQKGYNPSQAQINFFWRNNSKMNPSSFFKEQGDNWFWPGHGIRIDDTLIVFLMTVRKTNTGLGFEVFGWETVLVENPHESPEDWKIEWLKAPKNNLGIIVGSSSVLKSGEYVYAFGSRETVKSHPIYVARWKQQDLQKKDLFSMQWWCGQGSGWLPQTDLKAKPIPVFDNGQTELTIHYDNDTQKYLSVQTDGFGPAVIALRTATEFNGHWSGLQVIYKPPEYEKEDICIYAGKAHPQLEGADLILTYATNSFVFAKLVSDTTIYYPRFVKVLLHEKNSNQAASASPSQD